MIPGMTAYNVLTGFGTPGAGAGVGSASAQPPGGGGPVPVALGWGWLGWPGDDMAPAAARE